jgi:hypothetical protein
MEIQIQGQGALKTERACSSPVGMPVLEWEDFVA